MLRLPLPGSVTTLKVRVSSSASVAEKAPVLDSPPVRVKLKLFTTGGLLEEIMVMDAVALAESAAPSLALITKESAPEASPFAV